MDVLCRFPWRMKIQSFRVYACALLKFVPCFLVLAGGCELLPGHCVLGYVKSTKFINDNIVPGQDIEVGV